MNSATQGVQCLSDDGVELWQALEYRGQLRNNTLALLGQATPALKSGLNGSGHTPDRHPRVVIPDADTSTARDSPHSAVH